MLIGQYMYLAEKVVYTAIIGKRDRLSNARKDCSYVAFTDGGWVGLDHVVSGWDILPAMNHYTDPVRNAKIYKVVPHWFFDTEYSLWVDANFTVNVDMDEIIKLLPDDADMGLYVHSDRDCIYDEAEVCKVYHDKELIQPQMDRYRAEGYPVHNGLHSCSVILRKHTKKMAEFNELWWREIQLGSRRDQLSFDYCVWKSGVKVHNLPGLVREVDLFTYRPHQKGF